MRWRLAPCRFWPSPLPASAICIRAGPVPAGAVVNSSNLTGSRHLSAVDFVTPAVGWVLVERQPDSFVVLHTSDTGATWVRQLAGADGTMSEYLSFFDASNGVVAILGRNAVLYRTSDGGNTLEPASPSRRLTDLRCRPTSSTPDHGWLLAQASTEGEALLRTDDGGKTWLSLGTPVAYSDWAYRVVFSDRANGWLYSRSTGLYAYRSVDGGTQLGTGGAARTSAWLAGRCRRRRVGGSSPNQRRRSQRHRGNRQGYDLPPAGRHEPRL